MRFESASSCESVAVGRVALAVSVPEIQQCRKIVSGRRLTSWRPDAGVDGVVKSAAGPHRYGGSNESTRVVVVVVTPGADWRVEGFKDRDQEVDGGEADHVR